MKRKLFIGCAVVLAAITLLHGSTVINGARTIYNALIIGTDNSAAGTLQLANGSSNAHTIFGSGATTTNTIKGFTVVPTTGHVVTCTSSGTTCTLTDGGAVPTGGLALLEQHACSGASCDFTTCITSTYDEYSIELEHMLPATNTDALRWRASTDGGMNYDTGNNYSWARLGFDAGGASATGGTGVAFAQLDGVGISSTAGNGGFSGSLLLFPTPGGTSRTQLQGRFVYMSSGPSLSGETISGSYNSTTNVNAFQFLFSTGNITSGTVRCYGIAK